MTKFDAQTVDAVLQLLSLIRLRRRASAESAGRVAREGSKKAMKRRLRRKDPLGSPKPKLLFLAFVVFFLSHSSSTWSLDDSAAPLQPSILLPQLFATASRVGTRKLSSPEDDEKAQANRRTRGVRSHPRVFTQPPAADSSLSMNQILIRAGKRGLGGGIPGALAGMVQVVTLMWLRTIINYQCRYGTTFSEALKTLLREGGVKRLYRGLSFALIQAPVARFVSTAANDGVDAFFASFRWTEKWGAGRKTVFASIVVGVARVILAPIDTMKTVLQVDSVEGFRSLMRRVRAGRVGVLYQGAMATAVAAVASHYPWFYTYNKLAASEWIQATIGSKLLRNAGIGIVASVVSDTVVNAVRVIKTTKQAIGSKHNVSYSEAINMVVAADGWTGLFGRGLRTRIVANALQSIVFTVIWRALADHLKRRVSDDSGEATSS